MEIVHSAFYRFARIEDPSTLAQALTDTATTEQLTGSILLAHEGINGGVAGTKKSVDRFEARLRQHAEFSDLVFKRSRCDTPPYGRFKLNVGKRIVAFGASADAPFIPDRATQVSPERWRELLGESNVVVIDNRNSFEFRLGRFEGAVDPGVSHFSDFEAYIAANADEWREKGTTVAMYCTGGIRCERVAPWMSSLGLKVAELEGGILNYFARVPDANREWKGECFVFDNRIALDTELRETATTEADVYDSATDGRWRIERAKRLREAVAQSTDVYEPSAEDLTPKH